MVDWKSPQAIIAMAFILFTFVVFFLVLVKGLGGEQAIFLILGYIAGWISSIVLFFFRKRPPKE